MCCWLGCAHSSCLVLLLFLAGAAGVGGGLRESLGLLATGTLLADLAGEHADREHENREGNAEDRFQGAFGDADGLAGELHQEEDVEAGQSEEGGAKEETILDLFGEQMSVLREDLDDGVNLGGEEAINLFGSGREAGAELFVTNGNTINDLGLGIIDLALSVQSVQVLDVLDVFVDFASDEVDVGGYLLVVLVEVLGIEVADLALARFVGLERDGLGLGNVSNDHFLVLGLDDLTVASHDDRLLQRERVVEEIHDAGPG